MEDSWEIISEAIHQAAAAAFNELFQRQETFYYCSLTTTGQAHPPAISAWSYEALERATSVEADPETARYELKWSYADSPYYCFGERYFENVRALFQSRPRMSFELSKEGWDKEFQFRLSVMEEGMRRVDSDGIFGFGEERNRIAVLVEVMPPDETNVVRARRLNPSRAIEAWLDEASE